MEICAVPSRPMFMFWILCERCERLLKSNFLKIQLKFFLIFFVKAIRKLTVQFIQQFKGKTLTFLTSAWSHDYDTSDNFINKTRSLYTKQTMLDNYLNTGLVFSQYSVLFNHLNRGLIIVWFQVVFSSIFMSGNPIPTVFIFWKVKKTILTRPTWDDQLGTL